jgi:hypothetical protein
MGQSVAKLQFPLDPYDGVDSAALADLVHDCQPARFGFLGDNILDETYRKATKMDRSAFSVDFCPYESGIIDTVAQLLVANSGSRTRMNGVRAELYKLNVSGQFLVITHAKTLVDLCCAVRFLQSAR